MLLLNMCRNEFKNNSQPKNQIWNDLRFFVSSIRTALYEFQKKNRVNVRRSQTDKNCDGCSVNHRMIHINQRISKNQTWLRIKWFDQLVLLSIIIYYRWFIWDQVRANVCQVLHTACCIQIIGDMINDPVCLDSQQILQLIVNELNKTYSKKFWSNRRDSLKTAFLLFRIRPMVSHFFLIVKSYGLDDIGHGPEWRVSTSREKSSREISWNRSAKWKIINHFFWAWCIDMDLKSFIWIYI